MNENIIYALLIPFLGTTLGSAMVFLMKKELKASVQKILTGFAAGVMIAATIWSLLLPALEQSKEMERLSFLPTAVGFCLGMIFLLVLDMVTPHVHLDKSVEGPKSSLQKTTMMVFAVVLHNIPEGMAVGVILAGWYSGEAGITAAAALAFAIGIAIQNFPEGAIISMPLHSNGLSRGKSFWYGMLSGAVEPVAGVITILLSGYIMALLPYFLAFAGGAMIYVVIEELIPEMSEGEHSNIGTMAFMTGFVLMMILDVALG